MNSNHRVERILQATDFGRTVFEKTFEVQIPDGGKSGLFNPCYEDGNGSVSVFRTDSGRWMYKDHGNEEYRGDCFDFYAALNGFDIRNEFAQLLRAMEMDFGIVDIDWGPAEAAPLPPSTIKRSVFRERKEQTKFIDKHFIGFRRNAPDIFTNWVRDLVGEAGFEWWSNSSLVCSDPRGRDWILFSYLDQDGNIRTCKRVRYTKTYDRRFNHPWTLKRDKDIAPHYIHRLKGIAEYSAVLYGLQWINDSKVVFVVEGEKSVELGRLYLPQYNWVATGGANNLREIVLRDIGHLPIVLVPDTNKLGPWREFASQWDGTQPDGCEWTYNIQCWDDWHLRTNDDIKDGEDIADLMQCYHHLEFSRVMGLNLKI